jgi:Muramidase (flagellum-specific)
MKSFLIKAWISQHWFKIILLSMFIFLLQQKNLNLHFNLSNQHSASYLENSATNNSWINKLNPSHLASHLAGGFVEKTSKVTIKDFQENQMGYQGNLANTYSNMTYQESTPKVVPTLTKAERKKLRKQRAYVDRFANVAQVEMKKYGIPASIKLAQGLIETNAGESRLSTKNNNHFGMKCFSKKCKKGHCSNFTDDSHKDFFRTYKSAWESYRSHSKMLVTNKRYQSLFKLAIADYRSWAKGLYKAGYATDKRYAEKLISIIEELNLQQYDK